MRLLRIILNQIHPNIFLNKDEQMTASKEAMCPLFPDVVCPQGAEAAESCNVRLHGDYDPMMDFKDYAFMNCAIRRAREQEEGNTGTG